ncbi:MAG: hypothetical protein D6746_08520 [Bacteroidetes bacterium]|nr:MAG: hypothetical protein D6746_08520 [Bacteroidota bacterium]
MIWNKVYIGGPADGEVVRDVKQLHAREILYRKIGDKVVPCVYELDKDDHTPKVVGDNAPYESDHHYLFKGVLP